MSNVEATAFLIMWAAGMIALLDGKTKTAEAIGFLVGLMWLIHFWVTR